MPIASRPVGNPYSTHNREQYLIRHGNMKNNTPDIFKFRHETVERAIGRDRRDIVRIHSGNLDVDVSLEP